METRRFDLPGEPGWLGILLIVILGILFALIVFYVMRDMSRRGQPGWLWGLLVILAPVVGFLIWAFLRNRWAFVDGG
jgi:hypothetical protein